MCQLTSYRYTHNVRPFPGAYAVGTICVRKGCGREEDVDVVAARGLVPLVGEAPYQYTLYTHQIHFSLFRLSRGSYRSPKVPASFIDLRSEAT